MQRELEAPGTSHAGCVVVLLRLYLGDLELYELVARAVPFVHDVQNLRVQELPVDRRHAPHRATPTERDLVEQLVQRRRARQPPHWHEALQLLVEVAGSGGAWIVAGQRTQHLARLLVSTSQRRAIFVAVGNQPIARHQDAVHALARLRVERLPDGQLKLVRLAVQLEQESRGGARALAVRAAADGADAFAFTKHHAAAISAERNELVENARAREDLLDLGGDVRRLGAVEPGTILQNSNRDIGEQAYDGPLSIPPEVRVKKSFYIYNGSGYIVTDVGYLRSRNLLLLTAPAHCASVSPI